MSEEQPDPETLPDPDVVRRELIARIIPALPLASVRVLEGVARQVGVLPPDLP